MIKEPPQLQADALLHWRQSQGEDFPRVLWGRVIPGRLRRRGCYSTFPTSRQSQTMENKEKEGGRKKWKNKVKEVRRLAAPRPEHQTSGPIPGDCAVGGASPALRDGGGFAELPLWIRGQGRGIRRALCLLQPPLSLLYIIITPH